MCPKYGKTTSRGFEPSVATLTPLKFKNQKDYDDYVDTYLKTADESNLLFRQDPNNFLPIPNRPLEQNIPIINFLLKPSGLNMSRNNLNEKAQLNLDLLEGTRIQSQIGLLLPKSLRGFCGNVITNHGMRVRQTPINKVNSARKKFGILAHRHKFPIKKL